MNKFFATRTLIAADIISISLFGLNLWDFSLLLLLGTFLIDLFKCREDFLRWLLFAIENLLQIEKIGEDFCENFKLESKHTAFFQTTSAKNETFT